MRLYAVFPKEKLGGANRRWA